MTPLRRMYHRAIGLAMAIALSGWLAGCSTDPRLPVEGVFVKSVSTPKVMIQSGSQAARPAEYRQLLDANSPSDADRIMLDQLLIASEEMTGVPMIAGNRCQLLVDGPETFHLIFKDIRDARESVHLETFILENDNVGRELADQLVQASRRGVTVRLLVDAIGSFGLSDDFIEHLQSNGVALKKFHPVDPVKGMKIDRINNRDHRKIVVIDGRIAYTGGINFSGVYSRGSLSVGRKTDRPDTAWRDTHVRITGPVVAQFQQHFLQMWNKDQPEEALHATDTEWPQLENRGDMLVGVFASRGGDEATSDIYSVMAAAIGHAQRRIWITQAYFAPDDTLIELLRLAAKRGVDVKLILPGVSDAPLIIQASRSNYLMLLESGVRIYERTRSVLHAKTVVVDGVWSSVGSANYDYRSFVHNYELNAVIVSRTFGKEMEALFQADLQQVEPVTLHAWKQRPLLQRLKEAVGGVLRRWL